MSNPASVKQKVLLIIPAYNEEARIAAPLRSYVEFARGRANLDVRFLIVLNGCRDGTAAVVELFAKEAPEVSWMEYKDPIGKGGALLAGLRHYAGEDWVGFADADGATPASSLFGLLDTPVSDVMVGCRVMSERPLIRRLTSLGFNLTGRLLLGLRTRDTQCGAKFFRASLLPRILDQADTCDMAIDVDLLLAAKSLGAVIGERTVSWADQPGSKVRVFHTSSLMFLSVCRLFFLRRISGRIGSALALVSELFYTRISGRPRQLPPGLPDCAEFR